MPVQEIDTQILGKLRVSGNIDQQHVCKSRNAYQSDSKAVNAVRKIHGIRRSDDHQHGKGNIEPADIKEPFLEKWHDQL